MTEFIILISVGVVSLLIGLILGYSWGNRKGESSGFERGLRTQIKTTDAFLREYQTKFNRYSSSRRFLVRSKWDIEDLKLAATSQVQMMSESLIKMLIDNKVIRPYVLSEKPGTDGLIWHIGISLYCAEDPVTAEYDSLPFIRPQTS